MPLKPTDLSAIAESISLAFKPVELEAAVRSSTGLELFAHLASEKQTGKDAATSALINLGYEGWDRWLLIEVLALRFRDTELRRQIYAACPETLSPTRDVDQVIDNAILRLKDLASITLTHEDLLYLQGQRTELRAIGNKIKTLKDLKLLHEQLHNLHVELEYQVRAVAPSSLIDETLSAVDKILPDLSDEQREKEQYWIDQARALSAANSASVAAEAQQLIGLHMSRLNSSIFLAANDLSLEVLTESMPLGFRPLVPFIRFNNAIRELRAAMISRTITYRIWQEVDNEIPFVSLFLAAPKEKQDSGKHWLLLRKQLFSLVMLGEPFREVIEEINNNLTNEKSDSAATVVLFEAFKKRYKYKFLKVGGMLKNDYVLLTNKMEPPLTQYVSRI